MFAFQEGRSNVSFGGVVVVVAVQERRKKTSNLLISECKQKQKTELPAKEGRKFDKGATQQHRGSSSKGKKRTLLMLLWQKSLLLVTAITIIILVSTNDLVSIAATLFNYNLAQFLLYFLPFVCICL